MLQAVVNMVKNFGLFEGKDISSPNNNKLLNMDRNHGFN
jgi:hypothetical protein